jgi:enolase
MSEYNLLLYFYNKWRKSETNEEKLNVVVDYIMSTKKNEEYSEYFGIDLSEIDFMDKYDIEDYMEARVEELDELLKHLIRNYDIED